MEFKAASIRKKQLKDDIELGRKTYQLNKRQLNGGGFVKLPPLAPIKQENNEKQEQP